MEIALPEFPAETLGRLIYAAPLLLLLIGLVLLLVPKAYARLFGLVQREGRYGGFGEIRVAGGFLAGLSLAVFLFQDQPELPVTLGIAMLGGVFGRILAMMSDHAAGLRNLIALLLQAGLAGILLSMLFDVWTPESAFVMPTDQGAVLSFWSAAALSIIGVVIMFAPRIALAVAGLDMVPEHEAALGGVRSLGGMALATGAMVMANGSIMLLLGFATAMAGALLGRLLALVINRGNWIVQGLGAVVAVAIMLPPLTYVFGMM